MTAVVSEQIDGPSSVLISSSLCSSNVHLPDTSRLAVRVLVREPVSPLAVVVHHLRHDKLSAGMCDTNGSSTELKFATKTCAYCLCELQFYGILFINIFDFMNIIIPIIIVI